MTATATASAIFPGVEARLDHVASPRRRRHLALPVLHLAAEGFRLRRGRSQRGRSAVRHARRFRPAGGARARARPQGPDRPGLEPQLRTSIPGSSKAAPAAATRNPTGMSGPIRARRHAAQQLALGVRRPGLDLGAAAAAILPAPFPAAPAAAQPAQPGGAGRAPGEWPVLARARRGRLPARRDRLPDARPGAAQQPGRRRRPMASRRPSCSPCSTTSTTCCSPRRRTCWPASARLMDEYPGTTTLGRGVEPARRVRAGDRLHRGASGTCTWPTRCGRCAAASMPRRCARCCAIAPSADDGWACWSFSNHDVERAISRWNPRRGEAPPDPRFARLLMALLLQPARQRVRSIRARSSACRSRSCARGHARPVRHRLLARVPRPRRQPHADALARRRAACRLHRPAPRPGCRCRASITRSRSRRRRAIPPRCCTPGATSSACAARIRR